MTGTTSSYDALEALVRVRLSRSFFMRDFLYSEIAAWHGMRNVPDDAGSAIEVGRCLCEDLLEPLQATFGRIHVRSGYRSPAVNRFGNENRLNCASNEANYAGHIWDYADSDGKRGATACIVVPWLVDRIERGGSWTDMAWWIHDHLPYHRLYFFPKFAAFNISWHEVPVRRIDSYAPPKGCLTRPGMPNHGGSHADQYPLFPELVRQGGEAIPSRSLTRGLSGSPQAAKVEDDAEAADGTSPAASRVVVGVDSGGRLILGYSSMATTAALGCVLSSTQLKVTDAINVQGDEIGGISVAPSVSGILPVRQFGSVDSTIASALVVQPVSTIRRQSQQSTDAVSR